MTTEYSMAAEYLFIDPGETSGWATFDGDGEVVAMGQIKAADLVNELAFLIPGMKQVVYEEYRILPGKLAMHSGSTVNTVKYIGSITTICQINTVPVEGQSNQKLQIGYMWAGLKQPSNHSISHQWDAVAHGVFWLQMKKIRKPRIPDDN